MSGRRGRPGVADRRAGVITLYGRQPVAEALADTGLEVVRVIVAHGAHGDTVARILAAATARGVEVKRLPLDQVNRISRNKRQDQGVAADVAAPAIGTVEELAAAERRSASARVRLMALDGITTQENAGMILRSAAAAGLDGVIWPERGTAPLDPRVIKASAGTAFRIAIHRTPTLEEGLAALKAVGIAAIGLDAGGEADLFGTGLPDRAVIVVGAESTGLSDPVRALLDRTVAIPLAPGVESLNAACAATLAAFHLARA